MRDLLHDPLWQPQDLGCPIPDSPHAVSVCLPTWQAHVGYEEQDPSVHAKLATGYPRFVYNGFCRDLFAACRQRFAADDEACQVYPTPAAADRFGDYFRRVTRGAVRVHTLGMGDVCAVTYPERHAGVAKDYWQHSGDGISSRQAAACLEALDADGRAQPAATGDEAKRILRDRIARLAGVNASDVYLFPCGMSGIYAVQRALCAVFPGSKSVQFGFPYVDTLKIQQKFGPGTHFFPVGDPNEVEGLARCLEQEPVAGIFAEFPSNPLLASPDLNRLSQLSRRHGAPLVVDDTLATFVNADLLPVADVITTSLTKFFSGVGDVTGGSVILNPRSPFHADSARHLGREGEASVWGEDAVMLERNSRDFESRMRTINVHAERLADMLQAHPKVATVYYPKFRCSREFEAFQRPGGGNGGLLSVVLHDEASTCARVFDALQICKGPNLGTNYSLACLYTILAHYRELEFAESCGVSRHLIRISAGLEEPDDLLQRFRDALSFA